MILDFGGGYRLRQATPQDHPALCRVCLETGDAGKNATAREDDPDLLGLIYAVPYQVLEPELAFVIKGPRGVRGYLFGARDTQVFNARLAEEWYPRLRERVRDPGGDRAIWRGSDWARRQIHHPDLTVADALAPFPSHGHIDLLPEARGRGIGRAAMNFLQSRLIAAGSAGMHLPVNPQNDNALGFYAALGFTIIEDDGLPGDTVYVGKRFKN